MFVFALKMISKNEEGRMKRNMRWGSVWGLLIARIGINGSLFSLGFFAASPKWKSAGLPCVRGGRSGHRN